MQAISSLFGPVTIPQKRTSERSEAVRPFVEEINKERMQDKKWRNKLVTARGIAIKLSHIPIEDLYFFLSECRDYKNRKGSFSKYFFGALKVRPVDNACDVI